MVKAPIDYLIPNFTALSLGFCGVDRSGIRTSGQLGRDLLQVRFVEHIHREFW